MKSLECFRGYNLFPFDTPRRSIDSDRGKFLFFGSKRGYEDRVATNAWTGMPLVKRRSP